VLCEKPLALTLEETDRLMALARRKERHLLCRQYMRRAGFAVQIKQLIREGALGRVRSVKIDYVTQQLSSLEGPNGWRGSWSRAGGGVVMDLAIHHIDLLREIFGAGQVQASVCRRLCVTGRDRAEDFAVLLLEHSDGPIAQISLMNCDSVDQAPRFHWEFIGERGRVMVEGSWASANLAEIGPSLGRKSNFPQWWDAANQQSVLEAFDRVRKCAPSGESASEFRQNLATILDAYEWAAKEGAPGSAS
jgi:predicted dehydrogenase